MPGRENENETGLALTAQSGASTLARIAGEAVAGSGVSLPEDGKSDGRKLISDAAKAIASEIIHHIESMYPDAADAVAWNSCKRSISGNVQNTMKRLASAAEDGTMAEVIKPLADQRRRVRQARRAPKA